MTRWQTGLLWAAISISVAAAIVFILTFPKARADEQQDWIHANRNGCCDHRDCKPARVTMTFTGWQVEGADNVVPFNAAIPWPFGVPYACIEARWARCLFMGAGG